VPADRLVAILARLAQREQSRAHAGVLCHVAAEVTDVRGAGITLVSADSLMTKMCASDAVAERLVDLELTVLEGPCISAARLGRATDEPDLASPTLDRWFTYAPLALDCGAQAVFSFPIHIGATRVGALGLYRDAPGPLRDAQWSDGYLMASVVGRALLALQAGASPGTLADALERESSFDFVVHQAAGMIAVQASISVGDALVALRSHAFATNSGLSALAEQVVARETHLEQESLKWSGGRAQL